MNEFPGVGSTAVVSVSASDTSILVVSEAVDDTAGAGTRASRKSGLKSSGMYGSVTIWDVEADARLAMVSKKVGCEQNLH